MRILIEYLLPALLPSALWLLWLAWRRWRAGGAGLAVPDWQAVPWTWLLVAGGFLAVLLTIGGALMRGMAIGQYIPAHLDAGGHLVPGRVE